MTDHNGKYEALLACQRRAQAVAFRRGWHWNVAGSVLSPGSKRAARRARDLGKARDRRLTMWSETFVAVSCRRRHGLQQIADLLLAR